MSEAPAERDQLSLAEINLLLLLDTAGTIQYRRDGSVRWALDAEDVCDLLEITAELVVEWGSIGIDVRRRATFLLSAIARREPWMVGGLG
jgi:hypothetical protein